MPGRWESSGRPLFVRTVWIKGIRHVVLSKNDPLLREMVQDAIRGGHVSTPTSEISRTTIAQSPISMPPMTPDCPSAVTTSSNETLPESLLKTDGDPVTPTDEESWKTGRPKKYNLRWSESTRGRQLFLPVDDVPATTGNVERLEQNPLSDRVMKWLDLSGKSLLETTMVNERTELEKSHEGKKWRGGRHVKKFMKHRSASLNIINTQYDMTLTADIRIEGSPQPKHHQTIHFEPEKDVAAKTSRMSYELKRSNSVIPLPLPLSPDYSEPLRPTTTDGGASIATKTKLHIFVPLISENDSLSEENEGYF